MKKGAVFCFLFLLPVILSAQNWFSGSFDEALAKAKADGKPLLLDFFAETG
jgi:hypothetical protein